MLLQNLICIQTEDETGSDGVTVSILVSYLNVRVACRPRWLQY